MYYDTTLGRIQCYEVDGWGTCGKSLDTTVTLVPEYAGAVLNGSGLGTFTADFCSGTSFRSVNTGTCAASEEFNYYQWSTTQATQQSYTIWMKYQMPSNFKSFFDNNTIKMTGRTTATGANSFVRLEMFNAAGTQCGTTTTITTGANAWNPTPLGGTETSDAACTAIAADNIVTFKITVSADQNQTVRASNLSFKYKSL